MLSASSKRRWFNRGDVTGGICGNVFAGSVSVTGIQDPLGFQWEGWKPVRAKTNPAFSNGCVVWIDCAQEIRD